MAQKRVNNWIEVKVADYMGDLNSTLDLLFIIHKLENDLPKHVFHLIIGSIWQLQDGMASGEWDWSGIRDSSHEAKERMGFKLVDILAANKVYSFKVDDWFDWISKRKAEINGRQVGQN